MIENIEKFSNHIFKGSRIARKLDIYFYMLLHCKQSCKARFWSLLKSKTDFDGSSIDYTENVIAVNAPYITTKV